MNRVQMRFINDCLNYEEFLNDWESEFIFNLAMKPDDYDLTENENHKLNEIVQKVNEI